jgi:hypothetical protein
VLFERESEGDFGSIARGGSDAQAAREGGGAQAHIGKPVPGVGFGLG